MQKAPPIATGSSGGRLSSETGVQSAGGGFQFRHMALLTVIATYGLIVLGGTVRATDSGTACPDWPLCHGQVIPPFETQIMIEWFHRLAASAVGFMILGTVFWAWRKYRAEKPLMRAGAAAVVLLAVQVVVGGITVGTETAATVVAIHLTIALTLISLLIFITGYAFVRLERGDQPEEPAGPTEAVGFSLLPMFTMGALFALIIVGVYVSKWEAALVYPDWPLFDGKLWSAGGRLADTHYLHRMLAVVVGVLIFWLLLRTLRTERDVRVIYMITGAFVIFVVQVLVGAMNIWFELPTALRVVHLALASGLWGVLVFGVMWGYLERERPQRSTA